MRSVYLVVPLVLGLFPLRSATLEHLGLDEMAEHSTLIVRGRTAESRTVMSGSLIYTVTRLDVSERWKGRTRTELEVWSPGGRYGDLHQRFAGVPKLRRGADYVVFLWRGPSGRLHVVGLSQGLLLLQQDSEGSLHGIQQLSGGVLLSRPSGEPVTVRPLDMNLDDLRGRVGTLLSRNRRLDAGEQLQIGSQSSSP